VYHPSHTLLAVLYIVVSHCTLYIASGALAGPRVRAEIHSRSDVTDRHLFEITTPTMLLRRALTTSSLPLTIRQLLSAQRVESGHPVQVNGWVKSVRRQKNVAFAVVSDGSSDEGLQAVFTDVGLAKSLTNGSSVRLGGTLSPSPGKGQEKELRVDSVRILGQCDPTTYPIQKKELSVEYLRDHSHLRARTDGIASMLRLRDRASRVLQRFFEVRQFLARLH